MEHLVLRRGYLNVKGRQVKKWKKCWVKIQDGVLCYYNETEAPSDMIEAMPLVDGSKVERADKKESKEEYSLKVHQPANKSYVPLFISTDTESEMLDWLKDLTKSVDIGTTNIFGVDLSVTVRKNKQALPVIVEKCLNYLRDHITTAGIFRVSGAQSEVLAFKTAFDKGDDVEFNTCKDPHVVSNLLKLYLRELPNPLLTAEYYQRFIDANSQPADIIIEKVRQLVHGLPTSHRITLHYIMQFLSVVGSQSGENKMPPANLAIVFGPTILRPGRDERMEDAGNMEIANRLTERLIQNYDIIFEATLPVIKKKTHHHNLSGSQSTLPEGWMEHFTAEGKPYYYNTETKVTTWDKPASPVTEAKNAPKATQSPDAPRATLGSSPMTQRAKSLMFTPELQNHLAKIQQQKEENAANATADSLPLPTVPVRKRPPSGSTPAPPNSLNSPSGAIMAPDSDELKQKLAKRAQPRPPGSSPIVSPGVSPTLSHSNPSVAPPSLSVPNLPPHSNLPPPPNISLPPTLVTPPPLSVPPPLNTPHSLSPPPSLSTPPTNLAPPPVTEATGSKLSPGVVPRDNSGNSLVHPAAKISATRKTGSSPALGQKGHVDPNPLSLSTPASSTPPLPSDEDVLAKVGNMEARITMLEQQQSETNELLRKILDILENNNLL